MSLYGYVYVCEYACVCVPVVGVFLNAEYFTWVKSKKFRYGLNQMPTQGKVCVGTCHMTRCEIFATILVLIVLALF